MAPTDTSVFWKDCKKKMKNNFELFVCHIPGISAGSSRVNGEALIRRASLDYGACSGAEREELKKALILRTPTGKPYFKEIDIHFNVSHSENTWMCLVGPSCCGLDVQYVRPCNFEKIAGRFFSERELAYVKNRGIEGFFEIWVRKEAYGKYTGKGFFGECPQLVSEDGKPVEKIRNLEGKDVCFNEIYMGKDIKCVACIDAEEKNIKIRKDWDYEDYIFI